MAVTEQKVLDFTELMPMAYDLADLINASREVAEYLHWKQAVERDEQIQQAIRRFKQKKQAFEACEKYGHYHPDYHAALEEVRKAENELDEFETVRRFKEAEESLDGLLYDVSEMVAHSVSDSIKVPSNKLLPSGGCGSGGSCSGNCG